MSLSENSQQTQSEPGGPTASAPHPSVPPNFSGTLTTEPNLEKSIQQACEILRRNFLPEDDDSMIQQSLVYAWFSVYNVISQAGGSDLKERRRNLSEFEAYTRPGSNGERELAKLLRSMANQELAWRNLFDNGTSHLFL